MKMTDADILLFEKLRESELGKQLGDFLERLEDHVCDVRSMGPQDTPESMRRAGIIIHEELTKRVRLNANSNQKDAVNPNPCI